MAHWKSKAVNPKENCCIWCGDRLYWEYTADYEQHSVKPKNRRKLYSKRGRYGDGFFCGLRCAYQWAVRIKTLAETRQQKRVK